MFIELLDFLRCPNSHDESWLVLAARRTEARSVMEGVLGCPVCQAEFAISEGIVHFGDMPDVPEQAAPPDEQEALRLAATLDLTSPRGYVVLGGALGAHAPMLHALTDVELMLVNPPGGIDMGAGLSGLTIRRDWTSLPLAASSARAGALDDDGTAEQLASAAAVVSTGGRILAPASLALPEGLTELARDDRHCLWERTPTSVPSGIISLERRR